MKIEDTNISLSLLHNNAVEQAILGTILQYEGGTMEHISQQVTQAMFYQPEHSLIYGLMMEIYERGEKVDLSSVSVEYVKTKEGALNPSYTMELINYQNLALLDKNIHDLVDMYQRRQLRNIGLQLSEVGVSWERDTDEAKQSAVEAIKHLDDNPDSSVSSFADALKEVSDTININASGTARHGISTGFRSIDAKGGFQPSDLVVIAAESSQGKTSFAMDIAVNAAKSGTPVAVYSLEMKQAQLAARVVSADTGINSRLIMNERLNDNEVGRIEKAFGRLYNLPIYFDDSSTISVSKIYSSIRMLVRRKGIKLAVIDYLQILSTNQKTANIETFYGEVSRKLKNLAKELNICIVLLSQLSRSYDSPEPTLSRLRGSGQINEAADMTFLLYRPEVYGKQYTGEYCKVSTRETALVQCAKGRNVGLYSFICGFNAENTHFTDLDSVPQMDIKSMIPNYD